MNHFVLDASVVLAWCFEDEATAATNDLLALLAEGTASVPQIWPLEIANALVLAERRQRITPADIMAFIAKLEGLTINLDDETGRRAFGVTIDLAREQRLTAYDAAYLELAMRLGAPLATKDSALRDAAARPGVAVFAAN